MKIYSTVENAVDLVVYSLESRYMTFNTNAIRNQIYKWYNNTDVADPEVLAALVLEGLDWNPLVTYSQMLSIKEQWFPAIPDDYAIWEIEAAQYDRFFY